MLLRRHPAPLNNEGSRAAISAASIVPRRTAADAVALAFCFVAIAFLLCGSLVSFKPHPVQVSPLVQIDPHAAPVSSRGFFENGLYPRMSRPSSIAGVKLYGSWKANSATVRTASSAWYRPVRRFSLLVCGYPKTPGISLTTEVKTRSGILSLPISFRENPEESCVIRNVALAQVKEAVAFRIHAENWPTPEGEWIGFSLPFLPPPVPYLEVSKELLFCVLTAAAAIVFLLAPGLILRQKHLQFSGRQLSFAWLPFPGLLGLAALGLFAWIGPAAVSPRAISSAALWLLILYATYHAVHRPISSYTTAIEKRVLVATLALVAIAIAKATYSIGPPRELYRGEISRTLEASPRSDSRVSYVVVQLVSSRTRPFSKVANSFFAPWNFSHRGPLAGLAASPIVLASSVHVLLTWPAQAWSVFDPEGFSSYRIAMIVIACCSLLVVFGLARLFLPEEWALLAFLVAATTPFVIHEIYFIWPKLEAAAFVLLGGYLALQSRYFLAGLSLGLGYLWHPSALVWFPALAGLAALTPLPGKLASVSVQRRVCVWALRSFSIALGVAIWLVLWKLVNGRHFAQEGFVGYLRMAGDLPVSLSNWFQARLDALLNTLIPLHSFLFRVANPLLNSEELIPSRVTQFFYQYWEALPFGAGIIFFFCLARLIYIGFYTATRWFLLAFLIPFSLFTLYWGASITGMLRENLHPWFIGLLIFSVVIWQRHARGLQRFWQICSWALLFRGLEILLMLLVPAIWSKRELVQRWFVLSDIVALIMMIALITWVSVYTFRLSENLRMSHL